MITSRTKPKQRGERRTEVRRHVSDTAVIKTTKAGISLSEILDVSPSGIRATSPLPLPVDTHVEILVNDAKLSGSVRNCLRARGTQFHVGIGNVTSGVADVAQDDSSYTELERLTDVLR